MKITVATDLSASGQDAVDRALAWARKLGAELQIVHVVPDPTLAPAFADDVPGDLRHAEQQLQAFADSVDVDCSIAVFTAESAAEGILAASKDADYLFVGSQGKSAFERLRLGSVATRVLRQSAVPVVCCPHPEQAD